MTKALLLVLGLATAVSAYASEVLIVADEFPAMRLLARTLKEQENVSSTIVAQTNLPADLSRFDAVIVYIHMNLNEPVEMALIRYTRAGGKLIPLHHSISSGKRKNKEWFSFLGVELPPGEVGAGGYKWTESVRLEVAKLPMDHFITTNRVAYPAHIAWQPAEPGASEQKLPGFVLEDSEVYLNHRLVGEHTLLLGFRYTDVKTGVVYCQKHAGWLRSAAKGWIVYLKPGHSSRDFECAAYARIVANAVVWKP
jgi:hypothetical protein